MWSDVVGQIYVVITDRSHTCHVYKLLYTQLDDTYKRGKVPFCFILFKCVSGKALMVPAA